METRDPRQDIGQAIAEEVSHSIARKVAVGFALLFGFLFLIPIGGVIVQWLWNWLIPDLFGLRAIGLWEALGLLALSRILFGGFGKGGHHGGYSPPKERNRAWWKKVPEACAAPPHGEPRT